MGSHCYLYLKGNEKQTIPAAELMCRNKNQNKEHQMIRKEHIIHFDIVEQSVMKTDETQEIPGVTKQGGSPLRSWRRKQEGEP